MTDASTGLRSARPVHREAATHRFAIGQTVRLRGGYGVFTSRFGDVYRVTGTLPPSGDSPQYRIRNEREQYERVTTEDSLELFVAAKPGEGATLRDQTFSNGRK
ncbi:hypothetical protein [Ancylobacter sp. TS-1]|uniref:hypothetical protein n=1 Tax=Ancylobacter sp. TS-1 TaxID=1850374 RepID=UPI001265C277|nr:hypothetical protein [Ancylobacter sp. TS-1]QFR33063.1 hypothetical protein GBB76_07925 [Ancylobacter sp. TS-1]